MNRVGNYNFIAGEALGKGDLLILDWENSGKQTVAVRPFKIGAYPIGIAGSNAVRGQTVDFVKMEVGQVVNVRTDGAINAGDYLGTLPLQAIDTATEAATIRAVVVGSGIATPIYETL